MGRSFLPVTLAQATLSRNSHGVRDVLVAEADALEAASRDRFVKSMAALNHWSTERAEGFRAHFISEHLNTS